MTWLKRGLKILGAATVAASRACLKREGLAFVALIASIGGAAVLTLMLAWAMWILEGSAQWAAITNIAYGLLATVAIVILSLGKLLGGSQRFAAEILKAKLEMSQDSGGGSETK